MSATSPFDFKAVRITELVLIWFEASLATRRSKVVFSNLFFYIDLLLIAFLKRNSLAMLPKYCVMKLVPTNYLGAPLSIKHGSIVAKMHVLFEGQLLC